MSAPIELTVRGLLEGLGFSATQSDIDDALRWALIELHLRRQAHKAAVELGVEMIGYVGDYYREKWNLDTELRDLGDACGVKTPEPVRTGYFDDRKTGEP